jgi:hypothetical protein
MEEKKKVKLVLDSPEKNESLKDDNLPFKRKNRYSLTTGGIIKIKRVNKLKTKSTRRLKFSKPILERSSIVYKLPGTGEVKFKDYDKITGDIKRLERIIEKNHI